MQNQELKLKQRIIQALRISPSTNDLLAKELGRHLKAVESHTFRMARSGELKKLRRGLYANTEFAESGTGTDQIAATERRTQVSAGMGPKGRLNRSSAKTHPCRKRNF